MDEDEQRLQNSEKMLVVRKSFWNVLVLILDGISKNLKNPSSISG